VSERVGVSVPAGYDRLNDYSRIIVDAALSRGLAVEIVDPVSGELVLSDRERRVRTIESLSELTSAVAFRICDDKRHTRAVLARAGLALPPGREATFDDADRKFLADEGDLVVKPARGEQGWGITVGVTDEHELDRALERARQYCPQVILERRCPGVDLRVLVIGGDVVAASVRRPARITGNGRDTIATLIQRRSQEREAATGGASSVPLDDTTLEVVRHAGHEPADVLPDGVDLDVRRTANLHTGGTIHDVTDDLHPEIARAAIAVAVAIGIPVVGVDMMCVDPGAPEHVVIEANEQPGLANHEPRPTAEWFLDVLFPDEPFIHPLW
jgi:GNAT-family acetyltransferase (TIGR03103 family)